MSIARLQNGVLDAQNATLRIQIATLRISAKVGYRPRLYSVIFVLVVGVFLFILVIVVDGTSNLHYLIKPCGPPTVGTVQHHWSYIISRNHFVHLVFGILLNTEVTNGQPPRTARREEEEKHSGLMGRWPLRNIVFSAEKANNDRKVISLLACGLVGIF